MNNGKLPNQYARIVTDWTAVEEVNVVSASQAMTQQVQAGIVPASSEIALKRLGYSAIERAQIISERTVASDQALAQQIIDAVRGANNGDRTGGNGSIDSAHETDHSDTGQAGVNGGNGAAGINSGVGVGGSGFTGVSGGSIGVGIGDHGGGFGS
jgi:hypothetical protein